MNEKPDDPRPEDPAEQQLDPATQSTPLRIQSQPAQGGQRPHWTQPDGEAYRAQSASPPPFGGGHAAAPPPKRKSRKGLYILLFVLLVFLVFGLLMVSLVARIFSTVTGGAGPTHPVRGGNKVALLRIDHVIADEDLTFEIIQHYKEEAKIRAVLVRIDTPGGTVGASQELYQALEDLQTSGKRVVASFMNVAASGGYYVAAAAEEVFSNPGTVTGSIGVIFSVPNVEEMADKIGIRQQVVKSGRFKDIGSITRSMTPEEKQLLQNVIDDTHNQFVEAILKHRRERLNTAADALATEDPDLARQLGPAPTGEDLLRHIADGRILTGRQAHVYGLVDHIGTQADALKRVAEMAGISDPEIYEYRPKRGFAQLFGAEAHALLQGSPFRPGVRLEYRMP
ncbi:signal peptide peptidase SppA [bacterium]|nr:signal peptide peptidase SppA [bacterium]